MTNSHDSLIGKHILVGLTYLDHAGNVARQIRLHGLVTCSDEAGYTLRSTGETVTDVDFVDAWTIHPKPEEG